MDRRQALKHSALFLGSALSASAVAGVLNGCQATSAPDWEPAFLTPEQAKAVDALVGRIIPATDTPGAREVGVGPFIDTMLNEYYLEEDQERFVSGLTDLEINAQKSYSDTFAGLRPEQQDELLAAMAGSDEEPERAFFQMAKELTVLGFFTSEAGATQVLQYEITPGGFTGCAPLSEVGGKTWAM